MSLIAIIKRWLNALIQKFWAFLKTIFQGAVEQTLAALGEISIQIVQEIQNDPTLITDEQKRKAAFDRIKAYAIEKGIAVKDSIINLAIELAVQYLKVTP